MVEKDLIGKAYEPFTFEVEKGRLAMFARVIGEENPIYFDEPAAQEAGYRSIPAPPTFGFAIAMEARQPFLVLEDMAVDMTRSVHGEQSFTYHADICAGDVITGQQRVVDVYEKKGGALLFFITETSLDNQHGNRVCDLRTVVIVNRG